MAGFSDTSAPAEPVTVSRETGRVRWMTDRGLCVAAGERTLALRRRLLAARLSGVEEVVAADGMLLVVLESGSGPPAELFHILNGATNWRADADNHSGRMHYIPMRFDGADLEKVAGRAGLTVHGLSRLLCSLDLRVKFLGFQPGFAYLEGLPPALRLPRRATPRRRVPAGSVAIGGGYCGIYPAAGPGGWHLLGTTDAVLFDPAASPPARLQPGDMVRLVAA